MGVRHGIQATMTQVLEVQKYGRETRTVTAGIKRDPLRRARRVVRLLQSSDQRREGFHWFIQDGNQRDWFSIKDGRKRVTVQVPELQLLRDVKMRWDSVYMMLERLRQLRPVSCLAV